MKAKLSVTLDESLVALVDAAPGATRSAKLESVLRRYREVRRELDLRKALAEATPGDPGDPGGPGDNDRLESDSWRRVMQEAMWNPSGEATSGPSRSRRSRSRGRRSSSRSIR